MSSGKPDKRRDLHMQRRIRFEYTKTREATTRMDNNNNIVNANMPLTDIHCIHTPTYICVCVFKIVPAIHIYKPITAPKHLYVRRLLFSVLGIEPGALYVASKHYVMESNS